MVFQTSFFVVWVTVLVITSRHMGGLCTFDVVEENNRAKKGPVLKQMLSGKLASVPAVKKHQAPFVSPCYIPPIILFFSFFGFSRSVKRQKSSLSLFPTRCKHKRNFLTTNDPSITNTYSLLPFFHLVLVVFLVFFFSCYFLLKPILDETPSDLVCQDQLFLSESDFVFSNRW